MLAGARRHAATPSALSDHAIEAKARSRAHSTEVRRAWYRGARPHSPPQVYGRQNTAKRKPAASIGISGAYCCAAQNTVFRPAGVSIQ